MKILTEYLCLQFLSFFAGIWLFFSEYTYDWALLILFGIVAWVCSNETRKDLFEEQNHEQSQEKQTIIGEKQSWKV